MEGGEKKELDFSNTLKAKRKNQTLDKGFAGTYYTFVPSLFYMALLYCIPVQARFVCKLNAYSNPFFCILRNVGLIPLNTGETS